MAKVLHFADLHLGVENHGRPDPSTGLHTRLLDFLRSFDELVDFAVNESVDLVVFAGDAYKTRDPSPTHQREFAKRIHRLTTADIPVFLLLGNHDLPNALGRAHTLDIFATLEVANVYVGRRIGTHRIPTRAGLVQVVAIPWISRSHLLTDDDYKDRSLSELDKVTVAALERLLEAEFSALQEDLPTILAYHGAVQGAVYSSERSVMIGHEIALPASLIQHPQIDYVALGHIHRHQVLHAGDNALPMVYSGSVDRVDFGEENETKGFVLAEVERGRSEFQFVPLSTTRPFVTIETQATSSTPIEDVQKAIGSVDIDGAIVRVIIHTNPEKNALLQDAEIRALLRSSFKVASIARVVEQPSRPRLGSGDHIARLAPLDALREYLVVQRVPKARIDLLLHHARRIVRSEADMGMDLTDAHSATNVPSDAPKA
jgi:exonuclease SbcD